MLGLRYEAAEFGPNHSFYFHYDAAGEMTGYTYQPASGTSTECLLVKNLQGDVERVISDTGTVLASYTYDAWGSICQSSGSLANINPIRYRSYYYDPQVGRFVNADGQIDSNAGLVGTNLFSYTANNPVHSIDDSGSSLIVVAGAVLGGCAGGYAGYKIAESKGYTGWKKVGTIAAGAAVGGVIGDVGGYSCQSAIASLAVYANELSYKLPNITDSQIGKKLSDHYADYGLTLSKQGAEAYRQIVQNALQNTSCIKVGNWKTLENCQFWINNNEVSIVRDGNWISTFPLTKPGTMEYINKLPCIWSK